MIADRRDYLKKFSGWAESATIIKVSGADLHYLFQSQNLEKGLEALASTALANRGSRPLLIVVTLGGEGSMAVLFSNGIRLEAKAPGFLRPNRRHHWAGDTFHSGLLAWLQAEGLLSFGGLASLTTDRLAEALRSANACAALACTRNGADPPTKTDLANFLTNQ